MRPIVICLLLVGYAAGASGQVVPPIDVTHSGPVEVEGAPGQALHLARYVIAPHTSLQPHFHDGTQIGLVVSGTLTYTVLTGRVTVHARGSDGQPIQVAELSDGQTAEVGAGHWLVERADTTHFGANAGDEPLVIVTSSLLRAGAPLATPVAK